MCYRRELPVRRAKTERTSSPRPNSTSDPHSEWLAGARRFEVRIDNVTRDAPAIAVVVRARFTITVGLKKRDTYLKGKCQARRRNAKYAAKPFRKARIPDVRHTRVIRSRPDGRLSSACRKHREG